MRKVKWAVAYLEEARCLIRDPQNMRNQYRKKYQYDQLHVEIGCGKGSYSLDMAKKYPNDLFIAIEKNESAAGMAAKKFDECPEVNNLLLIQGDAQNISTWFAPKEVDIIHLNFSDPWPKKRYAKRRLSSKAFTSQYKEMLSDIGQIQMKTDNSSLFEYSLLEFQNEGYTMIDVSVDYRREEHDEDAITEYEQKFISLNQPIYRCVWNKRGE